MYYLELLDKFWEFNKKSKLGANVAAVYVYLLKTGYENGRYDFKVSDLILSRDLNLTRKTVKSIKQKLCDHGLIMFETRNGHPSFYRLLLNYSIDEFEKKVVTEDSIAEYSFFTDETNNLSAHDASIQNEKDFLSAPNDNPVETLTANQNINDFKRPTLEEFIGHAKTLDIYASHLDEAITLKYTDWLENEWRNAADRPITDWKLSLKSILPFLANKINNNELSAKIISFTEVQKKD